MQINDLLFKELVKRGYSKRGKNRVWDVSDSRLWYLTPALAQGFLNLGNYNPYRKRVIDDEISLLKAHAPAIVKMLGKQKFNLIDLGCGSGLKAEVFLRSIPKSITTRYCPIDISPFYIQETMKRLQTMGAKNVSEVKPFVVDFTTAYYLLGMLRNSEYTSNLSLLLGETISHYDIHDLLFALSRDMFPGDVLVIGNGIRTGKRFVDIDKYRNPLFNDWFIHLMRGLGFEDHEVSVDVRFTNERLEGFYHVLTDKTIGNNGQKVSFKKGDEIIVAVQYKFFERELKKYAKMYFSDVEIKKNAESEYCLLVCKK